VLKMVTAYGIANANVVAAVLSIASDAVALGKISFLERIHEEMKPRRVLQDSDSSRLLQALAILRNTFANEALRNGFSEWTLLALLRGGIFRRHMF